VLAAMAVRKSDGAGQGRGAWHAEARSTTDGKAGRGGLTRAG